VNNGGGTSIECGTAGGKLDAPLLLLLLLLPLLLLVLLLLLLLCVSSLASEADGVGFPLLVKAVSGGGGKGMKIAFKKVNAAARLSPAAVCRVFLGVWLAGTCMSVWLFDICASVCVSVKH
jgi:hypothetical protein